MKRFLFAIFAIVAFSVAANATVDGDVNGDGYVTSSDITVLYNYLLNGDTSELVNGDVTGDGDITSNDITYVYNILLGFINPVEPPAPVEEFTVNGVTFKMIKVEGGTYMMGIDQYIGSAYPAHEVTLSTYWIGETEVTQELWVAIMGSNPSYFNEYGGVQVHSTYDAGVNLQRPVDCVNYSDCLEFCAKLNEMTGKNFRLPTEAEWEFAARGGNLTHGYEYAGSENVSDVAWWKETIPSTELWTEGWGTQTVATKAPNELGIFDMTGNVEEWCYDWFATYGSAPVAPQTNPTGPETGTQRVRRGGTCLTSNANLLRLYYRNPQNPDSRGNSRGLRIALSAE